MRAHDLGTYSRTRALGALVLGLVALAAPAAAVERYGDFNGDGFADLAVGVPGESLFVHGAGAVVVFYGTSGGLAAGASEIWSQDSGGIADAEEKNDGFGAALVTGDFNGDGFGDLAIGVPAENVGAVLDAGAVHVFYGSAFGLVSLGSQLFTQDTGGVADTAEAGDGFGFALAAGDFDDDGETDLAIGVPGEDAGAGAVHILYGSPAAGLVVGGSQLFRQGAGGIFDLAEAGDAFGFALSAGDFNGDLAVDLAVGVPGEDFVRMDGVGVFDAGAVAVLYGDWDGLGLGGNEIWTQDPADVIGVSETGDAFGSTLTNGDFNGDACDDLVIGAPNDLVATGFGSDFVGRIRAAGAANVLYGAFQGLNTFRNQWFHEESPGMTDTSEVGDDFSVSIATGDFDGDGFDDLAIGVSSETFGREGKDVPQAGSVHVLYGGQECLHTDREQRFHQGSPGIPDFNELDDFFGFALTAGDFDGDGFEDLAIGAPGEAIGKRKGAGKVTVVEGRAIGLVGTTAIGLHENSPAVPSGPRAYELFGYAVASH